MNPREEISVISNSTVYNVEEIRNDFPILQTTVHDKLLVYLDNAATTQKPISVIKKAQKYYSTMNSNIHRGVHALSGVATEAYETARIKCKIFINALGKNEIIFTKGTTESINLVAQSYVRPKLQQGDEVIISQMEHHSNIVPWQLVCEEKNAKLKVIPINDDGEIIFEDFEKMLTDKTKFVSIVYASNSLGVGNGSSLKVSNAFCLRWFSSAILSPFNPSLKAL